MVYSFEQRVAARLFYRSRHLALLHEGEPWEQPQESDDYAFSLAKSTRDEVSAYPHVSIFEFEA